MLPPVETGFTLTGKIRSDHGPDRIQPVLFRAARSEHFARTEWNEVKGSQVLDSSRKIMAGLFRLSAK